MNKIRSEDLRRDAARSHAEPRTVIVELDLPQPRVDLASRLHGPVSGRPNLRIAPTSEDAAERERRVSDARHAIGEITGKAPDRFLNTSGTFVLEANGEQIRGIAGLKEVSAIWPNTRRDGMAF